MFLRLRRNPIESELILLSLLTPLDLDREPFEPAAESSCDELFLVCTVFTLVLNLRKKRNSSWKTSLNGSWWGWWNEISFRLTLKDKELTSRSRDIFLMFMNHRKTPSTIATQQPPASTKKTPPTFFMLSLAAVPSPSGPWTIIKFKLAVEKIH